MKYIDLISHKFHLFMVFAAKLMILGMVIITAVQVFCRYVLDFSIRWSEEVPLILMIWFGFISMSIGVKKRLHISIEVFFSMFPTKVQTVVNKFVDLSIMSFGGIMIYYGFNLAKLTMSSTMPATKMPTGFVYGVIFISGIMIFIDAFFDLIGHEKIGEEFEEVA